MMLISTMIYSNKLKINFFYVNKQIYMDKIYEYAKKLGTPSSFTSAAGTPFVEVKFKNEPWLVSKQKFYILTCNNQHVVVSMNENDIISAFNDLLNDKRPKKNEMAHTLSNIMSACNGYKE